MFLRVQIETSELLLDYRFSVIKLTHQDIDRLLKYSCMAEVKWLYFLRSVLIEPVPKYPNIIRPFFLKEISMLMMGSDILFSIDEKMLASLGTCKQNQSRSDPIKVKTEVPIVLRIIK